MEIYAAAALFFAALIPASFVLFGLAWQFRRLRRRVASLEARLARVEHPGGSAEPTSPSSPLRPPAQPLTPPIGAQTTAPVMPAAAQPLSVRPIVVTSPVGAASSGAAAQRNPVEGREPESLESRIGGQWLLYIGVLAILIGLAYSEKLAFESAWLGETARVGQGAAAGLLLAYAWASGSHVPGTWATATRSRARGSRRCTSPSMPRSTTTT